MNVIVTYLRIDFLPVSGEKMGEELLLSQRFY